MMDKKTIYVSLPVVKMNTYEITKAEADLVRQLYRIRHQTGHSTKVIAIQFIRKQYGLGLKEAVDLCDAVVNGVPDDHGDIVAHHTGLK